eukprot:14513464-Ditylum_brightwellii.AAC.1
MCWHTSYPSAAEDVMGTVTSAKVVHDRHVSLTPHGWGSTGWCSLAFLQELHQCSGPMFPSS